MGRRHPDWIVRPGLGQIQSPVDEGMAVARHIATKRPRRCARLCRRWKLHHRSDLDLGDIARWTRPMLLGWIQYYGRFHRSALRSALRTLDQFIVRWAQRKYKRLKGHTKRAWDWLRGLQARQPTLFAHWLMESKVGR